MGKTSVVMNDFVRNKRRFADVFNGFCFGGENVIRPEDLEEGSEQYMLEQGDEEKPEERSRFRDVKMRLKNGGVLRILAIENQDYVDYAMPFRCMEYDCLEYGRQLQELKDVNKQQKSLSGSNEWLSGIRKTDRLKPMYTVCVYHGEDEWDGPRTLREIMDFGEENEAYRHLDRDSVRVLSVLLKQPQIWEERAKYMSKHDEQEEYDMCLALREMRDDARAEGRADALALMVNVVGALREDGNLSDVALAELCECSEAEVKAIRNALQL